MLLGSQKHFSKWGKQILHPRGLSEPSGIILGTRQRSTVPMALSFFQNEDAAMAIISCLPIRSLFAFQDTCQLFRALSEKLWSSKKFIDLDNFCLQYWTYCRATQFSNRMIAGGSIGKILQWLLERCPNLVEIWISGSLLEQNLSVVQGLSEFPRLQSLRVYEDIHISEASVVRLIANLGNRINQWKFCHIISIKDCSWIPDSLFSDSGSLSRFCGGTTSKLTRLLCRNLPCPETITELSLKHETPDQISPFILRCLNLRNLSVSITGFLSSETSIAYLFHVLSVLSLKRLCLKLCAMPKLFVVESINDFFTKQVGLEEFSLSLFPQGNHNFALFCLKSAAEHCGKTLKRLALVDQVHSENLFTTICQLHHLEELSLNVVWLYGLVPVAALQCLPLRKLSLQLTNTRSRGHIYVLRYDLSNLTHLEHLTLHLCESSHVRPHLGELVELARTFPPSLKALDMSGLITLEELHHVLCNQIQSLAVDTLAISHGQKRCLFSVLCPNLKHFSVGKIITESENEETDFEIRASFMKDTIDNCTGLQSLSASHGEFATVNPSCLRADLSISLPYL